MAGYLDGGGWQPRGSYYYNTASQGLGFSTVPCLRGSALAGFHSESDGDIQRWEMIIEYLRLAATANERVLVDFAASPALSSARHRKQEPNNPLIY